MFPCRSGQGCDSPRTGGAEARPPRGGQHHRQGAGWPDLVVVRAGRPPCSQFHHWVHVLCKAPFLYSCSERGNRSNWLLLRTLLGAPAHGGWRGLGALAQRHAAVAGRWGCWASGGQGRSTSRLWHGARIQLSLSVEILQLYRNCTNTGAEILQGNRVCRVLTITIPFHDGLMNHAISYILQMVVECVCVCMRTRVQREREN